MGALDDEAVVLPADGLAFPAIEILGKLRVHFDGSRLWIQRHVPFQVVFTRREDEPRPGLQTVGVASQGELEQPAESVPVVIGVVID